MKRLLIALALFFFSTTLFSQTPHQQLSLTFADDLNNAKYKDAFAMFDSVVLQSLTEAYFEYAWQSVINKVGKLKSYKFSAEERSDPYQITYTTCHFEEEQLDLKLVFNNRDKIVGFFFVPPHTPQYKYHAPDYDDPRLYVEKEIVVTTGRFHMQGILTIPANVTKPAVVILVHGSGPNDMDESIGPNKTFRDIAVGLAAQGIATIRYEKRTHAYGKEMAEDPAKATVQDEVIDDAISAVNLVSQLHELDSNRIFLLGHSLGGMLAPRIAAQCKKIKGIILLAGNARPLLDLIPEQMKYIASVDTTVDTMGMRSKMEKMNIQIMLAKSPNLSPDTPDSLLPFHVDAAYWIDLSKYDQVKTAEQLTIPIYVLQGERDYQVTMTDFNTWKSNLSGKQNVEFKTYPKLNHLFLEGEGRCTPQEYTKPANVPLYVISDITNWIIKK